MEASKASSQVPEDPNQMQLGCSEAPYASVRPSMSTGSGGREEECLAQEANRFGASSKKTHSFEKQSV